MKNGWRMKEIDEMDMLCFLRLRAWDATREQEKKSPASASLMKSGTGGGAVVYSLGSIIIFSEKSDQ